MLITGSNLQEPQALKLPIKILAFSPGRNYNLSILYKLQKLEKENETKNNLIETVKKKKTI